MPQLQVVNTTRDNPEPTSIEKFFTRLGKDYKDRNDQVEIGKILQEYQTNRQDENAFENAQLKLMQSTVSPSKRLETQEQLNEIQKVIIQKKNALNSKVKSIEDAAKEEKKLIQNAEILRDLERRNNLKPGELDPYINDPKMAEKVVKGPSSALSEKPIDPEQLKLIEKVRAIEGFDELDELEQYRKFTSAGVSRANAESESKLRGEQLKRKEGAVEKAYSAQKDFINQTTDTYRGFETEMKPKLLQMRNIKDEDLIGPAGAKVFEALDIPLSLLENPSSELYNKLSLDLLKGLPETYGNRILKVEVDNFLKTIPSLLNSANGRRMIASNFLKLGEMKEVYYNEMRSQQKQYDENGKPLPKDFQQKVFDQVKPQIDRINEEFVKLSEITDVPKGTIPFFDPDGNVVFVPKDKEKWASTEGGGKRIW